MADSAIPGLVTGGDLRSAIKRVKGESRAATKAAAQDAKLLRLQLQLEKARKRPRRGGRTSTRLTRYVAAKEATVGRRRLEEVATEAGVRSLPELSREGRRLIAPLKGVGALALGTGTTIAAATIAGTMAYFLASAGLRAYAKKKEDLQENAFRASRAYRLARQELEHNKGRPLRETERKILANAYHQNLEKLGLSSRDLGDIMGRSDYATDRYLEGER